MRTWAKDFEESVKCQGFLPWDETFSLRFVPLLSSMLAFAMKIGNHEMSTLTRRSFLGAALAGIGPGTLLGADPVVDPPVKKEPVPKEDGVIPAFQPNSLFLTWQRDPTTTMTIQWVGAVGETADSNHHLRPHHQGCDVGKAGAQAQALPDDGPEGFFALNSLG